MLQVCAEYFGGDWNAMKAYAEGYDPTRPQSFGKTFRDLVGSRNRTEFWRDVAERDAPKASRQVADGDSIAGMKNAIELCRRGTPVAITVEGKVIGTLTPVPRTNERGFLTEEYKDSLEPQERIAAVEQNVKEREKKKRAEAAKKPPVRIKGFGL
jgi:antitoxin (DNA-binding transcriptional repressor) of toxin-antitoxin stability system